MIVSELSADAARQLDESGFAVVPGPLMGDAWARLAAAYDRAVATADAADIRVSTSTRVTDFVNRGPEFDPIYIHGPLLAACRQIIGRPFELSSMHARTINPGAPAGGLHVDVKRGANGWSPHEDRYAAEGDG